MSNNVSSSSSGGIGFVGALTILFIALKLTNVIDWEWLWVLSPLWISALLTIALLILFGIGFVVYLLWEKISLNKYNKNKERGNK